MLTERWLQDTCILTEQEALLKTGRCGNVHMCDDRMGGLRGLHLLIFSGYRPTGRKGKGIKKFKY